MSEPSRTDYRSETSDRLYTPEELEAYARAQLPGEAGQSSQSSQSGQPQHPPASAAPQQAAPQQPPAYGGLRADRLADPLSDPIPGWPGQQQPAQPEAAAEPPADATVVRPALQAPPAGPPAATRPAGPPPSAPPAAPPQVGQPQAEPPQPARSAPPQPEAAGSEPPRFMTATDFLDRRDADKPSGPPTWGWQGAVHRMTGGLVTPRMGPKEQAYERDRSAIQRDFDGPRTIAFVNPKGGAAKTTGVLAAGYTFGTVRGGGVVAWDNNETRGTLGIRGQRGAHRNTTRELLEDLGKFEDVYQSRIGDLGAFVRSQGDAHFDVLASDERAGVTGTIHADDYAEVHKLLQRFYRVILVDTGNNMRAENWLASAQSADLLVVTSTVREDTGYSGLWMLDALQDAGIGDLKRKTVTVLSDPSPKVDEQLASDLVDVYEQRTRGVYRVPYDASLVSGSVVPYHLLSRDTRMSWLHACAGMAEAL